MRAGDGQAVVADKAQEDQPQVLEVLLPQLAGADADWLKPLRQPGEYALAMTLVAGAESDLLTADFDVHAPSAAAAGTAGSGRILGGLALLAGLIALLLWRRGRKGGRA